MQPIKSEIMKINQPVFISKDKLYLSLNQKTNKSFNNNKQINLPLLKQVLSKSFDNQFVDPAFIDQLVKDFAEISKIQPNVIYLKDPIRVLGDIHGQYMDLLKLLSLVPALQQNPQQKLLFLGDYVDRGICGTEVVILLFAYKVTFPNQVFLLRGNHQSRIMTQQLNFFQQFTSKYPQQLYFKITDAFDNLPLAAVINQKYFCVHGGLSPESIHLTSLKDLNKIDRFQQIPFKGQMCDMIWADPIHQDSGQCQMNKLYTLNDSRGCSIYFGKDLAQKFLKDHKLQTVIRAHQIIDTEGFKKHIWPGWNDNPTVITIFSAPNYCGTYMNKAVILSIKNGKLQIRQFNQENPKVHLSPQYDAFNLSVPRLISFLDKFARNLTKSYANKNFPEFKKYDENKKIQLFLKGKYPDIKLNEGKEQKKDIMKSNFEIQKQRELQFKHFSSSQIFRRSQEYFADSQKLPVNKNYVSKSKFFENQKKEAEGQLNPVAQKFGGIGINTKIIFNYPNQQEKN